MPTDDIILLLEQMFQRVNATLQATEKYTSTSKQTERAKMIWTNQCTTSCGKRLCQIRHQITGRCVGKKKNGMRRGWNKGAMHVQKLSTASPQSAYSDRQTSVEANAALACRGSSIEALRNQENETTNSMAQHVKKPHILPLKRSLSWRL